MGGSSKRRKVSMNKKKNWRKHTNFEDVEDFLEEQGLQQRTGGLVADKKDEEIFFIDSATSDTKEEKTTEKRKAKKDVNNLKCFSNISVVADVSKMTKSIEKVAEKRMLKKEKALSQRIQSVKRNRQLQKTRGKVQTRDIWQEEDQVNPDMIHHLRVTRQLRVHAPDTYYRKTSKLPAIELPHPGASYNPKAEEYVDLLKTAHEVEVEKEKKAMKLKRALEDKFPTRDEAPTEVSYAKEMLTGTAEAVDSSDDSEDEWNDQSADVISINPPVSRFDKKTPSERRKMHREKVEIERERRKKQNEVKEKEVYRLRSIKSELAAKEKVYANRAWRKATLNAEAEYKPRKLGKLRYEEPDIEVKLTDELVGRLRQLKPEGDLMEDRLKSLQRRNILEPRQRQNKKRKYKRKLVEKRERRKMTL